MFYDIFRCGLTENMASVHKVIYFHSLFHGNSLFIKVIDVNPLKNLYGRKSSVHVSILHHVNMLQSTSLHFLSEVALKLSYTTFFSR